MSDWPSEACRFRRVLQERLAEGRPGLAAQQPMVPSGRPMTGLPVETYTRAAVLIAFFPERGSWRLPLILRTTGGGYHSGQVSLPGGRLKPGETDEQGALREAREEVGLDPEELELAGRLSSVPIPVSKYQVIPIMGVLPEAPKWRLQEAEVQELFTVGLEELMNPELRQEELMDTLAGPMQVPYFAFGSHKVWGATGIILAELAALLSECLGNGARSRP